VTPAFIGLDWGTSSLRAYLASRDGDVLDMREDGSGILASAGRFEETYLAHVEDWPEDLPAIAAGMIGSRQGWIEAPYCPCPAGLAEISQSIKLHTTRGGRRIAFVPGLSCLDDLGVPDVLRGEETQVFGAYRDGDEVYLLPGTHSKWLWTSQGRITRFSTFMSGEVFAALKGHTILGRLMVEEGDEPEAFAGGVNRGHQAPELFLHTIFGTRTLGLFETLAPGALSSYLSGVVIGAEIGAATRHFKERDGLTILASPGLTARYQAACEMCNVKAKAGPDAAALKGLARIAAAASLFD
jgi:2-dehydro-3-deoxygalactonokinase